MSWTTTAPALQHLDSRRKRNLAESRISRPPRFGCADVDFYVRYADSWKWDITIYLKELHIQFYDVKDGVLLASGSFSNSFLHSFPDPGQKVSDVIASMYGEN